MFLRNGTYPISVSSERIFQALAIARYANEIGADAIAHGSTGAGNDQIRFDMTFLVMAPGVEIITLTRDMALSRREEIDYLNKHGFAADFTKLKYSYNVGLWGHFHLWWRDSGFRARVARKRLSETLHQRGQRAVAPHF